MLELLHHLRWETNWGPTGTGSSKRSGYFQMFLRCHCSGLYAVYLTKTAFRQTLGVRPKTWTDETTLAYETSHSMMSHQNVCDLLNHTQSICVCITHMSLILKYQGKKETRKLNQRLIINGTQRTFLTAPVERTDNVWTVWKIQHVPSQKQKTCFMFEKL